MTPTDIPLRPRWNHQCVKEATAALYVEDIREWAEAFGVVEDNVDDREFLAVLCVALIESPDSYQAGRYLEDFFSWPVQSDLIRILDRAYAKMKYVTRDFVHTWVTENNVRFPAKKGDTIRVKIGDVEVSGEVVEVIRREAKGIFIPQNRDKPIIVLAEEVQQVMEARRPRKKRSPKSPEIA